MVKKFLALAVAAIFALLYPPPVSAEQAVAETYRQMFRDGNFYVEFQIETPDALHWHSMNTIEVFSNVPKTFNRVSKRLTPIKKSSFFGWGGTNPFSAKKTDFQILAGKDGARVYRETLKAKNPDALYKGGRYYNFFRESVTGTNKFERRMLILSEENLNSINLYPAEGWQDIRADLALPDELAIFYWNDPPFQPRNYDAPVYLESSKLTFGGKEYDCDKYVEFAKDMAGNVINETVYNALYENGKLVMVQKYFQREGDKSAPRIFRIKTITSQVPDSIFEFKKKIKLYKTHNGDMNDLLKVYEEIGEIGGKKK